MSDPDTREKRSRKRKQNIYAKILRDPGEHKGAFALKIKETNKYKREKLNPRKVIIDEDET